MRSRLRFVFLTSVFVSGLLAGWGCAGQGTLKPAGRTAEERARLVKPGLFGNNAAADRLRRVFDFRNEQIIREDRVVGTVFMGDSITEFWQLNAYFSSGEGIMVNRGIGGDITPHMAARFEADVIQLRPRNVVIMGGTNDVFFMLGQKKPDAEIIESVCASIASMLDAARSAGINVLLCSITPTNSDRADHTGKSRIIPPLNERLKQLCAEKGCIYVDYAMALSDADGNLRKDLADDGLHPHWKGYAIMARVLRETAAAHGLRL